MLILWIVASFFGQLYIRTQGVVGCNKVSNAVICLFQIEKMGNLELIGNLMDFRTHYKIIEMGSKDVGLLLGTRGTNTKNARCNGARKNSNISVLLKSYTFNNIHDSALLRVYQMWSIDKTYVCDVSLGLKVSSSFFTWSISFLRVWTSFLSSAFSFFNFSMFSSVNLQMWCFKSLRSTS